MNLFLIFRSMGCILHRIFNRIQTDFQNFWLSYLLKLNTATELQYGKCLTFICLNRMTAGSTPGDIF